MRRGGRAARAPRLTATLAPTLLPAHKTGQLTPQSAPLETSTVFFAPSHSRATLPIVALACHTPSATARCLTRSWRHTPVVAGCAAEASRAVAIGQEQQRQQQAGRSGTRKRAVEDAKCHKRDKTKGRQLQVCEVCDVPVPAVAQPTAPTALPLKEAGAVQAGGGGTQGISWAAGTGGLAHTRATHLRECARVAAVASSDPPAGSPLPLAL